MVTEQTAGNGSMDTARVTLAKDMNHVLDNANEMLKGMSSSTLESFASLGSELQGSLSTAKTQINEAQHNISHKAKGMAVAADGYVKDHTWTAIGLASVAGLLTGYLISRRD